MNKRSGDSRYEEQVYTPTNDASTFGTYDLGCSAALIDSGFALIALDRANPRKAQFLFQRAEGIDKVVDEYWTGNLTVEARNFFDTIKMLKNRLYSE